jgi:hypothetical protein
MIPIHDALLDRRLLGAALGDPDSWDVWITTLKAAFGEKLTRKERIVFATVAGPRKAPSRRAKELWCVVGRGGGKSRMSAAIAVYLAAFQQHKLAAGEEGFILALAGSRDQAGRVFDYALAFLRKSPVLRKMIASTTAHEIRLRNGVTIAVHSNSFRLIRGRTLLACIFDEVAYWRDADSANPDQEVLRAVKPSLVRTSGMLIGISSPYRQSGLLYDRFKDHYGVDGNEVLVVRGPTFEFNRTINRNEINKQLAADPDGARADWLAEFRSDRAALLDATVIADAVDYGRPLELPPRSCLRYHAFVDPSGGRGAAFTIVIAHLEKGKEEGERRYVADIVRGHTGKFDPQTVVREYAQLAREYGCTRIIGDNFAAEWVAAAFAEAGARYERCPIAKSQLYLESVPLFNRGVIQIPDHPDLLKELRQLERRTHRSGKDSVDHPRHGSDDFANSLVGAAYLCDLEIRRPKMRQGAVDFTGSGRVTWQDNEPRPQLRWVTVTEREMLDQKAKGTW